MCSSLPQDFRLQWSLFITSHHHVFNHSARAITVWTRYFHLQLRLSTQPSNPTRPCAVHPKLECHCVVHPLCSVWSSYRATLVSVMVAGTSTQRNQHLHWICSTTGPVALVRCRCVLSLFLCKHKSSLPFVLCETQVARLHSITVNSWRVCS